MCGWNDVEEITDDMWGEFDATFDEALSGVEAAEYMKFFHLKNFDVTGAPRVPLSECDLNTA